MKKLLTVSFVALISVISAGNAAIPDKTYVDDTVDTAVASKVDVVQDVANAIMVTDESGNVVANTEVAEFITALETVPGDIETLGNAVRANQNAIGATTNLTTTDKSSLVAAVNEVRDETGSVAAQASELSSKVDHLEDIDAELRGKIDTNAGQIETQGAQIAAYGDSITGLDDRLGTAESDISALKTDKVNKTDLGNLAYQDKLTNNFVDDAAIAQAKVNGLTDALAAKVDDSQVVATGGTVTSSDAQVPTIARMDDAISTAVSAGVKSVDLSSRVPVAQGESNKNAVMITDEHGDVVASTEVADFLETIPGELDNRVNIEQGEDKKNHIMITNEAGYVATTEYLSMNQIAELPEELNGKIGFDDVHEADLGSNTVEILDNLDYDAAAAQVPSYAWALKQANQVNAVIGGKAEVVDLESLDTVNKTSLVAAINEVNGNIAAVAKKGDSVSEELADDQVPTVAHMKEAISDATEGIDLSGKLDVANVVTEDDNVDDGQANSVVPSYKRMQDEISRAVVLDEGVELNVYAQDVQGDPSMSTGVSDTTIPSVNAVAKNFLPVPTGECANKANKCALVTGVDENNNLIYSWEVIARNINASEATE